MQVLCRFDELEDNGSKGFSLRLDSGEWNIFVVRRGDQVYGYRNVCPHRGTNLDWLPDRFMDPDREYIQCATHDALFRVEDGVCVAGPCVGKRLTAVPVSIDDGVVRLDVA